MAMKLAEVVEFNILSKLTKFSVNCQTAGTDFALKSFKFQFFLAFLQCTVGNKSIVRLTSGSGARGLNY